MERMPRLCGTAVNSAGTVLPASFWHSAESGFCTEELSTDWMEPVWVMVWQERSL